MTAISLGNDFDDFEERPPSDGLLLGVLLVLSFEIEPVPTDERGVLERFTCCTLKTKIIIKILAQSLSNTFWCGRNLDRTRLIGLLPEC